jgi:hypothetical protein
MTQPASPNRALRFPLVLRHVAVSRELLARAVLPGVGRHASQTWWELVDAAGDDTRPPSAVAVTGSAGQAAEVALLAAAGEDRAALEQLVEALVVALRATAAETVVAAGTLDRVLTDVLLRVGFVPVGTPRRARGATARLLFEL